MSWQLLFSFKGRINRAPYWIITAIYIAALLALFFLAYAFDSVITLVIAVIFFVLAVVSAFAIMVKRLHDRNKSAWWVLLFYILPAALHAMHDALVKLEGTTAFFLAFACSILGVVISIWALVELGFLRGTPGPNRYGPNPLEA